MDPYNISTSVASNPLNVVSEKVVECVEAVNCVKSEPPVNTSYETCIFTNVASGPIDSS